MHTMTIQDIQQLPNITVTLTERFATVTPAEGYVLLVGETHTEEVPTRDGGTQTVTVYPYRTNSLYIPLNCTTAPHIEAAEEETTETGI